MRLPVGCSRSIPAYRSGCSRDVAADLELVGEQRLHPLFLHDQNDQVYPLGADLETCAAARKGKKRGRTPRAVYVAGRDTLSMLSANAKPGFHHVRHHGDALSILHYVLGNSLVWLFGYCLQNFCRIVEPFLHSSFVFRPTKPAQSKNHERYQYFSHNNPPVNTTGSFLGEVAQICAEAFPTIVRLRHTSPLSKLT